MREQVDRLLACEWQIRWDGQDAGDNAFAVRDVKISNEYAGSLDKNGAFAREIRTSEAFYSHLVDHAVPLNEVAIRELKGIRSEEHTSEIQSLMRISYAVFCLKKETDTTTHICLYFRLLIFFFFNATAPTEIYTY